VAEKDATDDDDDDADDADDGGEYLKVRLVLKPP
jgi:hypothetical protein